jgi:hypothetical protein
MSFIYIPVNSKFEHILIFFTLVIIIYALCFYI